MNKETLKALRGSIAKWKAIAEGKAGDRGHSNCPLCILFHKAPSHCSGCPVAAKVEQSGCVGTPYNAWADLDAPDVDWTGEAGYSAASPKAKRAARREQRFLESLLPVGEQP